MTVIALPVPGVDHGPGDRPRSYEEYLVGIGLSPKTIKTYAYRVAKAERLLEAVGADLLTADAFELAAMAAQTATSHSMRGQLRCALKHFYEYQDRLNAPLRAVRVPPQPRMVCKALDSLQARSLASVAKSWWPEGGAVILGLYMALRREEIATAEWERFDPDMEWYTVLGKRSKTSTIPVHPVIREVFEPRRRSGWIFPGRFPGRHVAPATVWAWTHRVGVETGIRGLQTHQLRHTSLTTALDATSDLRAVMEFARHERPQTTAGYTRTTRDQLRAVSDAISF